MIKKTVSLLSLAILASCVSTTKTNFELKGNFTSAKENDLLLLEELGAGGAKAIDSARIDNKGQFVFKHAKPKLGFYRVKYDDRSFALVILDTNSNLELSGDIKDLGNTYNVKGSEDTKNMIVFNEFSKKFKSKVDSLNAIFSARLGGGRPDSAKVAQLQKEITPVYEAFQNDYAKQNIAFIREHKTSIACLAFLQSIPEDKAPEIMKELDKALVERYPKAEIVKQFHQNVSSMIPTSTGSDMPEISLMTQDDKPFNLSSLKGQVVLVDFWASWCGPCRKTNPSIVALYNKYKAQGFTVLGVSLDENKEKWIEAIAKDGLTWNHISDLGGWNSSVVKQFRIEGIPFAILVSKDGKILGKGLHGDELEEAIENAVK